MACFLNARNELLLLFADFHLIGKTHLHVPIARGAIRKNEGCQESLTIGNRKVFIEDCSWRKRAITQAEETWFEELLGLAGEIEKTKMQEAVKEYGIDPEKPSPITV